VKKIGIDGERKKECKEADRKKSNKGRRAGGGGLVVGGVDSSAELKPEKKIKFFFLI
jgi:hypothetical protein